MQTFESLEQICLDEHGVKLGGKKGNLTLALFDGSFRIERSYQKRSYYDESIKAAQMLMTDYICDKAVDAPELVEMVHLAGGGWCGGHGNTSSWRSWAA
jgi:hypothetical protein